MNWDHVAGNWEQFKGRIKAKWGFLSDDELDMIAGKRDVLVATIVERYGITKDRVEEALEEFLKELDKAA